MLGGFKIDFLHLHVYDHFTSREEITELLKHEPDWGLMQIPSVVKQLFQFGNHYEMLQSIKPTSIIETADALALIRPQKSFMLKKYLEDRNKIRPMLYTRGEGEGGYAFKKAHAISYAMVVVLQLHLIKGGVKF